MTAIDQFKKGQLYRFIILTYVIFWVLLGMTGLAISLGIPPVVEIVLKNICAWSSTFAILILFKRIYPQKSLIEHLKDNFSPKIKLRTIGHIVLIQGSVFLLALISYSIVNNVKIAALDFIAPASILPILIINLTSGAVGEELGWRGFAYQQFRQKYSLIQSAVLIGLIWGFWHFPLWLLSGYQGGELFLYIVVFMISIIEVSILIALFYDKNRNLFLPILIHFLYNVLLQTVKVNLIPLFIYTAIFNGVAIIVLYLARRTSVKQGAETGEL
jgi:hypothetical protein